MKWKSWLGSGVLFAPLGCWLEPALAGDGQWLGSRALTFARVRVGRRGAAEPPAGAREQLPQFLQRLGASELALPSPHDNLVQRQPLALASVLGPDPGRVALSARPNSA